MNLLFVCLGNICRSPAAEEIMRQKGLKIFGERGLFCDSAGTSAYHKGQMADRRMRDHALKRGLHLGHRSRPFGPGDFDIFDYIFVMDKKNKQDLLKQSSPEQASKIFLCTAFSRNYAEQDVPDPYYSGEEGFEQVLDILEDACEGIMNHLQQKKI